MNPLLIPIGTYVRLIKRSASKYPLFHPASWNDWDPAIGNSENYSLPVDYTLRGRLINPIKISCSVLVFRIERNGIFTPGFFQSTPVREVDEFGRIVTDNSIYEVTRLITSKIV